MKKYFLVLMIFISGCSEENSAPSLSTESVFYCSEYNESSALKMSDITSKIRRTFLTQMTREYKGDSEVEVFFREHISKKTDYLFNFTSQFELKCLEEPKSGVNEAAVSALSDFYSMARKNPYWAMCYSYNDGTITIDDIDNETTNPSVRNIAGNTGRSTIRSVLVHENYGSDYIQRELENLCATNPNNRLWSTAWGISSKVVDKLNREYFEAIEAEREAEKEKERMKEREAEIKRYDDSLYKKDMNNCADFKKLVSLANRNLDYGDFSNALLLTLNDIPLPSDPELAETFKRAMDEDTRRFTYEISKVCHGDLKIEDALMRSYFAGRKRRPFFNLE